MGSAKGGAIGIIMLSIVQNIKNVYDYIFGSLFRKLLISFFAIITITVTMLGSYYYTKTSQDIKRREIRNMETLSEQAASALETKMTGIQNTMWNFFSDIRFQNFVITLGANPEAYDEFSDKLSQFMSDYPEVDFFVVSQLEGNQLLKGNFKSTDIIEFERLKQLAVSKNGRGAWVPSVTFESRTGQETSTLAYVQALKKTNNFIADFPLIGIMMVQLSHESLTQWLQGIWEHEAADYLLTDQETGQIRIASNPDLRGRYLDSLRDEGLLFVTYPLANTPWSLVGIANTKALLVEVEKLALNTIYLGIACLLGSLLMASLLSSRILTPLKELKKGIVMVEKGDYDIQLSIGARGEIGYIIYRFNQMAAEIKSLIMRIYETDLVRKESEIKSLQSQINPHFLYNTLGVIESLATLHDDDRISMISRSLAKMFRYNISSDRMSTIQMELGQIRLYLYIQQQRYGERVHYTIESDEQLDWVQIPKLLFQPLVENCFVHTFDRMTADGLLKIRIWRDSHERLFISVWNNGPAIEKGKLKQIQEMLGNSIPHRRSSERPTSVGLLNVHHRVKLLYGNEYGLSIESHPEQGTEAVICFRELSEEERKSEDIDH
ncbi:histidine kinase [Paenibacillus sp. YN15]|uniref:sensor histidine kinase n=1 Tax=Paenibacillus sp. YN15 TaxID=1742774 RepID=UPI0015EBECDB|nr:histidine kinase [Paenibacillus sp. YN15]